MGFADESELFQRAAGRLKPRLPHPTSSSFDKAVWKEALGALLNPNERDIQLAQAAVWIGGQIDSLRRQLHVALDGVSRPVAVQMMVAIANRDYLIVIKKAGRKARRMALEGEAHMDTMIHALLHTGRANQRLTADSLFEQSIDTLPHWLYHAWQQPRATTEFADEKIRPTALRTMALASIERSFRHMWQQCLWAGWSIQKTDESFVHAPFDRDHEETWQAWFMREQALSMQRSFFDGVAYHGKDAPKPMVDPVIARSVVGYEDRPGKRRVPIVGRLPSWGRRQKHHLVCWAMVRDSYLAPLLTKPLPAFAPKTITLEMVFKTWCVIGDLSEVLLSKLPQYARSSHQTMRRFALPITKARLVPAVANSLKLEESTAAAIIDFLTVIPTDTSALFNRGFWSAPLVPAPNGATLYILASVLAVGSPLRAAEAWLERGGATNGLESKGRHFERQVRSYLSTAIAGNDMLGNAGCATRSLPTAAAGEEIDALLHIGNTVIAVEAKCLISPSEPLERYNFISNLEDACRQARRKADWLDKHRHILSDVFGWEEAETATASILPLVVTNLSFGLGYSAETVSVIDLHYLRLLCSGPSYVADTAVRFRDGATATSDQQLYSSADDLEKRLSELLIEPVPLKRFEGVFDWIEVPFPEQYGRDFRIMMPTLANAPTSTDIDPLIALVEPEDH